MVSRPGDHFTEVSENAKQIATEKMVTVQFDFNEVICLVNHNTNLEWLNRDYSNSWTMGWKTVGPDCAKRYSGKLKAEFEEKTKIAEAKAARDAAEYRKKQEKEQAEFEVKVKGVELELSDVEGWNKSRSVNSDGYGGAALDYAEGWGKLMQVELAKGKTIADCYEYTQKGLGFLGITGFQFGCAVSVLSQTWKHGEKLRKYHNKKYGVKEDKGGTVNPAIITFS